VGSGRRRQGLTTQRRGVLRCRGDGNPREREMLTLGHALLTLVTLVRNATSAGAETQTQSQSSVTMHADAADAADAVFPCLTGGRGGEARSVERAARSSERVARSAKRGWGNVAPGAKSAEGGTGGDKAVGRGQESASKPGAMAEFGRFFLRIIPAHGYTLRGPFCQEFGIPQPPQRATWPHRGRRDVPTLQRAERRVRVKGAPCPSSFGSSRPRVCYDDIPITFCR